MPGCEPGQAGQVRKVLEEAYGTEPFVRVLQKGLPHTKWVYGSNFIDIGIYADEESGQVILVSALDNLTKGASGQAIQNLNVMFGWPETKGLLFPGVHLNRIASRRSVNNEENYRLHNCSQGF